MRLRRALWRLAGPAAGRLAPRPARAYYELVTRSLVEALMREPELVAVYAHGSYASGELRLGKSDVDLVCVIQDAVPEVEAAVLARLRRLYRRRQAVLPLDLVSLQRGEFARGAGWLSWVRTRVTTGRPVSPVSEWRLLAGEELRAYEPWQPDGRLWYITEAHVAEAIRTASRSRLEVLAGDLERGGLSASALRSGDLADAIQAALVAIETHRGRTAEPPPLPASSATLITLPFEREPTLLLETADAASARPAIERALQLAGEGTRAHVTTTLLAEDSWRSNFRWLALQSGTHVEGVPLAPRVRTPPQKTQQLLLEARAWASVAAVRRDALGARSAERDEHLPQRLALIGSLLSGDELAARDGDWTLRGLELWQEVRSLVRQEDTLLSQAVAVD